MGEKLGIHPVVIFEWGLEMMKVMEMEHLVGYP
jgi:hypothetical protein